MKESLKEIILMGLGAVSLTDAKASKLKKELLERGKAVYKEGAIKNEELKRSILDEEEIEKKDNEELDKDEIADIISNLSDEDKKDIIKLLNKEDNKEE